MSKDRTPFGERMYEARRKSGLKQLEVCSALGISQGTLSEAERVAHSSSRVAEFAQLYGVDPIWLSTGDVDTPVMRHIEKQLHAARVQHYRRLHTQRDLVGFLEEVGAAPANPKAIDFVPDFVAWTPGGQLLFAEVKPYPSAGLDRKDIEARAGKLPGEFFLIGGDRPIEDGVAELTSRLIGYTPPHPGGVAQILSQARPTVDLPLFTRETLVIADLTKPFELEVWEDALMPDIFKGCVAILDPGRSPEPAWPVLIRDQHDNFYLRDYEVGPNNSWRAVARAKGFAPLDSSMPGLTIVAAMEGYKRPRRTT